MKIPITKPFFDDSEKEFILKPLESGWLVQGPFVSEFERLFSEFTGASYAIATSNCTTALQLALEAFGIGQGDKVIIPAFTYVASANAVENLGGEVVFCDIDLKTYTVDVSKIEQIIKKDKDHKIKAIMPVNLFGLCANLPEIISIASKYSLSVIEDSACGFGAYIKEHHSGTFGNAGCFSFHPRKSITTGEGGMVVTNIPKIAEIISMLRDHGASKSDLDRHEIRGGSLLPDFNIKGYNYRMTDLQGAIGVCQIKKANKVLNERRSIAAKYKEALKEVYCLIPPSIPENYTHGYQSYVCMFCGAEDIFNIPFEKIDELNIKRNKIMYKLEERGIATRQGTHAVHTLGYYVKKYNFKNDDFIMSYAADRLSITLPLYARMSDNEFDYVITHLKSLLKEV